MTRQDRKISVVLLIALMRRGLGVFLSCLLAGNSVASSVVEGSFWKERRKSVLAGARTHSRSAVPIALTTGWPAPGPSGLSGQTVDPLILETLPIQSPGGRSQPNDDPLFPVLSKMVRSLPNEWGTVRSIVLPPGPLRRIVVHIQDIHEHTEAQTHISRAVRSLLSTKAVDVVGLEGAFAPLALEPFRRFPHKDTMEIVADDLLKRHVISGPVHGGMLLEQTSVPFVGVDDQTHHRLNVEAYRQSLSTQTENSNRLDEANRLLESRKEAVFSPTLLEWDRALRAYREGKVGLAQHVETLSFHALRLPPQLKILQKAVALEKRIDFGRAEQERAEVVKRLVQGLSEQTLADLATQSAAFKAGRLSHGAFYGYLKRLCESSGLPWESYSAFRDYVTYVLMAQSLRMDQVQKELLATAQATSARLARSKEEKSLLAQSEQLRLLSLLTSFTLTPTEWAEFKDQSFPKPLVDLVSNRNVYESFYREAEQRENAMSTRLLEAMGTGKNKTAVLVAGGFHSAGLRTLLTAQGTAVIEFVPRVTKIEAESGSAYLSIFSQDKTPLEQLFTAEKLFVAKSPMAPTTSFEAAGLSAAVEASREGMSADDGARHFLSDKFRSHIKRINTKLSDGKTNVVFFFKKNAYRFTHFISRKTHGFEERALPQKGSYVRRPPFSFLTARFLARVLPWNVVKWIVRTGRVETLLTSAFPQYFAEVVYYLGLNTGLIYRSYTRPGRLAAVDNLMIHLGIKNKEEGPLIYDVGPGFPPMTSYETGKNTGARVVTYETGNPTYLVTLGTVGKNGESPLYVRFNEKSELLSVWRYGGNRGVGFNRFLLARYLLLHYLITGQQWDIGLVRKDPSLLSLNPKIGLERRTGNLFSELDAPAGEYADAVRVANVLGFQNREDEFAAIEKLGRHLRVGGKIYIVDGGAEQMEVFVYEKTENHLVARFYAVSCDPGNEHRFEVNLGTDRYGTRGWLFNSFAAQRKEISRITSDLQEELQWSPQAVVDKLSNQFPGVTSVGNLYLFPLTADGKVRSVTAQTPLTRKMWDGVVKWFPQGRKSVQAWARFTADKKVLCGLLISGTLVVMGYTVGVIMLLTIFQVFATVAFIGNLLFSVYFLWISHKHPKEVSLPTDKFKELPMVTIQLPMYNEANVAERVIRSAAAVDYPPEKLEIQVLDDSTDDTKEHIQRVVEELKRSGTNVVLVRRENRKGYKAGALREGLTTAQGEFIAIFDADFVVPRDFLQRTIHYFTSDKVAMVEGRWGHLNRNNSSLTQAQASWLDAHMFIEQGGKNREGLWVHFHGTGGVWRKTAIADAGGWLERTVTEDGDLSYRALLKGWNMVYLRDYESPAELPPTMQAYLAQQYRWHKGGAQVFKFLVGGLIKSSYSAKIKMTTLHRLVNPFLSPVSLFSMLLLPIVYLLGANVYLLNVGWVLLWSVLTPAWLIIEGITYRTARLQVEGEDWSNKTFLHRWSLLPIGVMLNIGTTVHKSWAVVDALFGKSLVFERTPKYNSVDGQRGSNIK